MHLFPSFEYLMYTCLDEFMLLTILRLQNAESLSLYNVVILKLCYVMLRDVVTTLVCYRSPRVNHFDLKGDLNLCFRKKLPVYDLEMLWPNGHTFRCQFMMMHMHRVVVYYAD